MELSTAVRLIEKGVMKSSGPQHWADLGAGDGLFTQALASIIPAGSTVLAIDKNSLRKPAQGTINQVKIVPHRRDFTLLDWGENFKGVLMANALHYVHNQVDFLTKLKVKLSRHGRLLVVEYERSEVNPWVPYPVPLSKLQEIGAAAGFSSIKKMEETTSIYDRTMIYSACLVE